MADEWIEGHGEGDLDGLANGVASRGLETEGVVRVLTSGGNRLSELWIRDSTTRCRGGSEFRGSGMGNVLDDVNILPYGFNVESASADVSVGWEGNSLTDVDFDLCACFDVLSELEFNLAGGNFAS